MKEKKICLHNIPKQLFQAEMTGEIALGDGKGCSNQGQFYLR